MRLAEEFEAAFGRSALDDKLLRSIPDSQHSPSHLHSLLLSLPWADVFTTNYDTLLERARAGILDRRYDIVLTQDDLPDSEKPRIVKLHGSFPSTRPFVITEEDFRTYPRRFSAFVNTIQQSIMENLLCLIGFSGDDPNFLHWTGWVRDNLGKACPQIYLCGFLTLTTARRNMLHDRNVVPIDLSPLFPESEFPDPAERHEAALEWFLLSLERGRPPRPLEWPNRDARKPTEPSSQKIPPVFPTQHDEPAAEPIASPVLDTDSFRPEDVIATWSRNRRLFPGWLVLPAQNRAELWKNTECWISPLLEISSSLPPPARLKVLDELVWRLDRCLMPLQSSVVEAIRDALLAINPFPHEIEPTDDAIHPDEVKDRKDIDWTAMRQMWAELQFALVRYHREQLDVGAFNSTLETLQAILPRIPGLSGRIQFQRCLLSLERMDRWTAKKLANSWPTDEDPFAPARRAAILAEVGDSEGAKRLASETLSAIRQRMQPASGDIYLLSREAWCMMLVYRLNVRIEDLWPQFLGRWEILDRHRCDPVAELSWLDATLKQPGTPKRDELDDPWRSPYRVFSNDNYHGDEEKRGALQVARFLEDSAYLLQGRVRMPGGALLRKAADSLSFHLPSRSVGPLLRLQDSKMYTRFFTSHRLATMEESHVVEIYDLAAATFEKEVHETPGSELHGRVIVSRLLPPLELMTVLVKRLPASKLVEGVRVFCEMYNLPTFHNPALQLALGQFVTELLSVLPAANSKDVVLNLLTLPLPRRDDALRVWSEPNLPALRNFDPNWRNDERAAWTKAVSVLIREAKDGNQQVRESAIIRLMVLHEARMLTSREQERFGKAMWKITDDSGLPAGIGIMKFGLLRVSEPRKGATKEALRSFFLQTEIPTILNEIEDEGGEKSQQIVFGPDYGRWFKEVSRSTSNSPSHRKDEAERYIDWTENETRQLFDKAAQWWTSEGKDLTNDNAFSPGIELAGDRIVSILEFLQVVVLPRCTTRSSRAIEARNLINEIDKTEFSVLRVLPAVTRVFPELMPDTVQRLRCGLLSPSLIDVQAATFGVYDWLLMTENEKCPEELIKLLAFLGSMMSNRRQPALRWAMSVSVEILRRFPKLLDGSFVNDACVCLGFLKDEAKYRKPTDFLNQPIAYEDVPEHRKLAVALAVALKTSGSTNEQIVEDWIEIGRKDPLPEVRNEIRN